MRFYLPVWYTIDSERCKKITVLMHKRIDILAVDLRSATHGFGASFCFLLYLLRLLGLWEINKHLIKNLEYLLKFKQKD